ncbi:MAG: hypothetical protein II610_09930 [Treponema sp.]|nr:hypothetical protein [Treponema sp.]MBQ6029223.1 hypothetical protein [Treponema sp.]MEE3412226.1 hypothetical protein [Treponema sp.]MEE3434432.1 hypothetical protein [Treponema sp.]
MANGQEDLREKNKNKAAPLDKRQFSQWNNFQGREDAEMLEEKSSRWNAQKAAQRRDYYKDY